jgi:hypothetical protein
VIYGGNSNADSGGSKWDVKKCIQVWPWEWILYYLVMEKSKDMMIVNSRLYSLKKAMAKLFLTRRKLYTGIFGVLWSD